MGTVKHIVENNLGMRTLCGLDAAGGSLPVARNPVLATCQKCIIAYKSKIEPDRIHGVVVFRRRGVKLYPFRVAIGGKKIDEAACSPGDATEIVLKHIYNNVCVSGVRASAIIVDKTIYVFYSYPRKRS